MTCESCNYIVDAISDDEITLTGRELEFFCPICFDQNLQVATLQDSQVCACPCCHGFLIDSVSLGALIGALRANYKGADDRPKMMDRSELATKFNCPTCFEPMYTHPYHGPGNVVLNSCSLCQLNWLDAGELSKIVRAPGRR